MSTLYLGGNLTRLAGKLAEVLEEAAALDCFRPVRIVVPNRNMRRWLQLLLARRDGVALNLQFPYLESVLWDLLSALDPRDHPAPLARLEDEQYRLLTLAALLDETSGTTAMALLRQFLGKQPDRRWWRRAWQLAERMAGLIRDYEYHRHEAIVGKWLVGKDAYPEAPEYELTLERAQRGLFHCITRIDQPELGLRARLGELLPSRRICKTLPQYAGELRYEVQERDLRRPERPTTIPIFGTAQLSAFHVELLKWLGGFYDLRLFVANPLVSRIGHPARESNSLRNALQAEAEHFRRNGFRTTPSLFEDPGEDLLRVWGTAGAESLLVLTQLLTAPGGFRGEVIPACPRAPAKTVLERLQGDLLGGTNQDPLSLAQDVSVQVVACPGIYREVETVHASIVHNLLQTPDLKQTDIAVLVTDMPRYRPVLQAVFERSPRPLQYNLADFSAADLSTLGQALLNMLDLALESFTRSGVFEVLLNPCVLARLGVEREQASVWLHWAEELGVHHGWDVRDQEERGYPSSPLFGWQLALRRLRLGRLMTPCNPAAPAAGACYEGVAPHSDFWSDDKEQRDAFCRAVEGLLPCLRRLRSKQQDGERWAQTLRGLVEDFLAVPEEMAREASVRDRLLRQLDDMRLLDGLRRQAGPLPLALVREFVADCLEKTVGTFGAPLIEGVTIATPELLRGLPFRVIYVLGLGEDLFPGSDSYSNLDLRRRELLPGDIRPTETQRFLFLEALLAARDKVYLLYDCRELQRDQELHPSSVVNQLSRYLQEHVLPEEFRKVAVPLRPSDACFPAAETSGPWDVLVNYLHVDRLVALREAKHQGRLPALTAGQKRACNAAFQELRPKFTLPPAPLPERGDRENTVAIQHLVRFLRCPAEATVRRHLHLIDDDEPELEDEEPFQLAFPHDLDLLRRVQEQFVRRAVDSGVDAALGAWETDFEALHKHLQRYCRVPEGAFGDAIRARFRSALEGRIAGLESWLRALEGKEFVGPVRLGPPLSPVGARLRLPALLFDTFRGPAVLVGGHEFAWLDRKEILLLAIHAGSDGTVRGGRLCRPLLAPLLLGVALRAGEAGAEGQPFRARFAGRGLRVCIASQRAVEPYCWSPDDLDPPAAHQYLLSLIEEFLDPSSFDLMPVDLLWKGKGVLEWAYDKAYGQASAERKSAFAREYQDTVDEDRENSRPTYRMPKLLRNLPARVPPDAFDKLRRRFLFLDQGLARAREDGQ
jgi:exonuclease V gamma subunit